MPSMTKTALAALFILGPVSVVVLAGSNNRIYDHGSVRAVSVPMSTGRTGVVNQAATVLTNACQPSQFVEHRNKRCPREVPFGKRSDGSLAMSELDLTEQHAHERTGFAAPMPISISRDDTRDLADHRMLYVLGFGIAGAIVSNTLVFIYFAVVYA